MTVFPFLNFHEGMFGRTMTVPDIMNERTMIVFDLMKNLMKNWPPPAECLWIKHHIQKKDILNEDYPHYLLFDMIIVLKMDTWFLEGKNDDTPWTKKDDSPWFLKGKNDDCPWMKERWQSLNERMMIVLDFMKNHEEFPTNHLMPLDKASKQKSKKIFWGFFILQCSWA